MSRGKKKTREEVIKEFRSIHGYRYNYDLVEYKNTDKPIQIECKKHGYFNQTPATHIKNSGCPKCARISQSLLLSSTTNRFVTKARLVHGDRYDYSKVEYKGCGVKISVKCDVHGCFTITPSNHLMGSGCYECFKKEVSSNTEEFINKAKIKHGNKYDYSLVYYVNTKNKIEIKCHDHGVFSQLPGSHLNGNGCPICCNELKAYRYKSNANEFITKSESVHGDRYTYDLVDYKNNSSKVKIICPIHGVFEQTPSNHIAGKGCSVCRYIKSSKNLKEKPNGWNVDTWDKKSKQSKNFDSFKVYVIKCWNETESFYKIGRTYRKVKSRFRCGMPYNYEVIKEYIFDNAKEAFDYENKLKREHKVYKYLPLIPFDGQFECFSELKLNLQLSN